jgi:thiol:disulfide interchange protein
MKIYSVPSFYALALTGFLLLIILITIIKNINTIKQETTTSLIKLLALITMAIGVHGLLHLGLEYVYNYNPINTIKSINYFNI